jgi:hypothetical protein
MPLNKAVCTKCFESKEATWLWANHIELDVVKKDRFGAVRIKKKLDVVMIPIETVPAWCPSKHD